MKNAMTLFAASCAVAAAVACGSSSSGTGASSGTSSSGGTSSGTGDEGGVTDEGGGGDSSVTQEAAAASCMSAMDCTSGGGICCLTGVDMSTFTPMTACSTGTCPAFFGMTIQLCASSSECTVAGQTCMAGPGGMGMICSAPQMMRDGGFPMRDSGSPGEGGSGDGGGDAAPRDAGADG